jgi:UPF0042 nucleotide-binding protein
MAAALSPAIVLFPKMAAVAGRGLNLLSLCRSRVRVINIRGFYDFAVGWGMAKAIKPNAKKSQLMASDLRLVFISGLAGSGYSTALDILEDIGFSVVDNLPLALIDKLVSTEVEMARRRVAVSLDGRTSGFDAEGLVQLMADIRRRLESSVKLVFLSASDDELYRRFNATRRHHPLDTQGDLMAAIADDWARMALVQDSADIAIDTSYASPTDFRRVLLSQLGLAAVDPIPIYIQSFSYREGIPHDADIVLDMRFLDNPHWQSGLAVQTGLDADVQAFLSASSGFNPAMESLEKMLNISLPSFSHQGRPRVSIAVGCTGGRHRSVFVALTLAEMIKKMGHPVDINHREIQPNI